MLIRPENSSSAESQGPSNKHSLLALGKRHCMWSGNLSADPEKREYPLYPKFMQATLIKYSGPQTNKNTQK